LMSEDGRQVLIYLRNTMGGIKNFGDGRPCYLRDPQPTTASLKLNLTGTYQALIYDLDEGKWIGERKVQGKGELLLERETTHDYIVVLKR